MVGPQLGHILDKNRDRDIFLGSESRKSPDLTRIWDLGSQNIENVRKSWKKWKKLAGNHSYTSPAHSESSATPQNLFFLLFSIPNESPDPPELRPGNQKWWKTSTKYNFSNLSGNHFYTSPVHSANSRHLKRCFSSISLQPIGSETADHTLLVDRCP